MYIQSVGIRPDAFFMHRTLKRGGTCVSSRKYALANGVNIYQGYLQELVRAV